MDSFWTTVKPPVNFFLDKNLGLYLMSAYFYACLDLTGAGDQGGAKYGDRKGKVVQ